MYRRELEEDVGVFSEHLTLFKENIDEREEREEE